MIVYYSRATRGFYTPDVHGSGVPSDAVSISEDEWRALLDAQSKGMEIQGDETGRPMAVHPGAA